MKTHVSSSTGAAKTTVLMTLALGYAICSPLANAAIVITPISATAPDAFDANRTITETIDGSGLIDGNSTPSNILDDTHTVANGNVTGGDANNNYWLTSTNAFNSATYGNLGFNLGGSFDLDGIHIWQYARTTADNVRGIKTFDIYTSTDGVTYTLGVPKLTLGDFAQATGTEFVGVQTKNFTAIADVTHVELRNIENFGGTRAALSELRFSAVPEPSAALLGGLGLLALLRRRRN